MSTITSETPRTDAATQGPVVLFDGVCNLCNATVQWIIRHDRRRRFRFAALQSEAGLALAGHASFRPDSIVLIDERGRHVESDAVIRIAMGMGWPWRFLGAARLLPRVARDRLYAWVALNRYRWFGRQNTCMVPTAELRERFLDATAVAAVPEVTVAPTEAGGSRTAVNQ